MGRSERHRRVKHVTTPEQTRDVAKIEDGGPETTSCRCRLDAQDQHLSSRTSCPFTSRAGYDPTLERGSYAWMLASRKALVRLLRGLDLQRTSSIPLAVATSTSQVNERRSSRWDVEKMSSTQQDRLLSVNDFGSRASCSRP